MNIENHNLIISIFIHNGLPFIYAEITPTTSDHLTIKTCPSNGLWSVVPPTGLLGVFRNGQAKFSFWLVFKLTLAGRYTSVEGTF